MLIGYSRISTDDQNLNLQCDSFKQAGCETISIGLKSLQESIDSSSSSGKLVFHLFASLAEFE